MLLVGTMGLRDIHEGPYTHLCMIDIVTNTRFSFINMGSIPSPPHLLIK